jgi:hypothetical protein
MKKELPAPDYDGARKALLALVSTIEATGGVLDFGNGTTAPVADDDWIDLGDAYLAACAALGREPKIVCPEPDEDVEQPTPEAKARASH